ncbi:unnamed protein product [Calypogeia fissa]
MVTRVLSPPPELIPGQANIVGTDAYIRLFPAPNTGAEHFRRICTKVPGVGDLLVSSLGIGTGGGPETDEGDTDYRRSVTRALALGINIIDTSISYRSMRSERAVGWALARAVAEGRIERSQVVVCTKGGYLTFECDRPAYNLNPKQWIENTYFKRGIISSWADIVHGIHCIAPKFIRNQVERSRKNLGLQTIDIYYLQNPEVQLLAVSREEFYRRMVYAFKTLEELCVEGKICIYGVSSWNGFRVPYESEDHLSLEDCIHAAHAAGGENHHFRVVQVPFNLQMREASESPTQEVKDELMSFLGAAAHFGLYVIACGALQQQKLTSYCGDIIRDQRLPIQVLNCIADLGDQATDAQCALQFARTTPGIVSAIAGMKSYFHVEENAEIVKRLANYQFHPVLNVDPFQWRLGD